LEERIAKDGKTRVERTDGYSNNLDALRREFGIDPEGAGSQGFDVGRARTRRGHSQRGLQREEEDPFAGLIDPALLVHANPEDQVDGTVSGYEDAEENEHLTASASGNM